jgi:hypothetical protein
MPENRELGGYTKVKENSVGDTVVVKKDLLGRTVDKTVIDPKEETWTESLVHKADQTIKDVAHRLEHKSDTTNTVVLDKDIPKKTKGTIQRLTHYFLANSIVLLPLLIVLTMFV